MFNPITELPEDAVVFDTETTGFDPESGDRIVEIGAVKMRNGLPTKESYHCFINPQRTVPPGAVQVHGLTTEFLSQFDPIENVIDGFLDFVGDLPMVAHNASFDAKFINFELAALGRQPYAKDRYFDTLAVARKLYPGASATLDALCRRHNISLASRDKHGALIDSELLAEVIVEMGGGRQTTMFQSISTSKKSDAEARAARPAVDTFIRRATPEEMERHQALISKIGESAIWNRVPAE